MAVSTAYSPVTVAWSSTNQAVAVTWPFFTGTLVVTEVSSTGVETVKTITTHYAVAGGTDANGKPDTGTVTMVGAATSGSTLRVTRATPKTQATTWPAYGAFPESAVEAALDKLTLIGQEGGNPGAVYDNIGGDVLELVTSGTTDYWDGEDHILRNLVDGVEDDDAVTVGQLNDAVLGDLPIPLAVSNGGTNASTVAGARSSFDVPTGLDDYAGASDTAKLQAALASSDLNIRLTRNITLTSAISLPNLFTLDLGGYTITKGFSGDMVAAMGEFAKIINGRLDGAGATYSGGGIVLGSGSATHNQSLLNVDIINTVGPNLEIVHTNSGTNGPGINFAWIGGSFYRYDPLLPAIKMPTNEASTSGFRRFIGLQGNGSYMMDLAGSNFTAIIACGTAGVTFSANTKYCMIDDATRIAQTPTIDGTYNHIYCQWSAPVAITINSGATYNTILVQAGNTVTDNSGSTTNNFIYKDRLGNFFRGTGTINLLSAADNNTFMQIYAAGNVRFAISTDASGHVGLVSQNSVDLRLGVGTADDLVFTTTSLKTTLPFGYASGAGGSVTQLTSKSTAVTLDKSCGMITMHNAALAAGATVGFQLNNSKIATSLDVVLVSIQSGATANSYTVTVATTSTGQCVIEVRNTSAGSLSDSITLNFAVFTGINS